MLLFLRFFCVAVLLLDLDDIHLHRSCCQSFGFASCRTASSNVANALVRDALRVFYYGTLCRLPTKRTIV